MRTTLTDRIKSIFASDKKAYWWNHFTDEEKQLRRMDVWQLARVINEARIRNLAGEAEKLIVAEHMLSVRLAKIQTRATYISIVAGLVGIVGGAFLTSAFQKTNSQPKCVCECGYSGTIQQNESKPLQTTIPAVEEPDVSENQRIQNVKQSNAQTKP